MNPTGRQLQSLRSWHTAVIDPMTRAKPEKRAEMTNAARSQPELFFKVFIAFTSDCMKMISYGCMSSDPMIEIGSKE